MDTERRGDSWDADYRARGTLYGSAPQSIPEFPDGVTVLEIGCGNGKTLLALCQKNRAVVAIDYSPRAVTLARAKAYPEPGPRIIIADALTTPFRDRSFDAISACHILGHSTAHIRILIVRELMRLLRPGGLLWFLDFSSRDFRCGTGQETEEGTFKRGNGIMTHYFTEQEVRDLFSQFEPVSFRFENWTLRVRGTRYPRSEIVALFRRPCGLP